MRIFTGSVAVSFLVALLASCATSGTKYGIVFQDEYIVGGGFDIEYQATEPGRAILVDVSSRRALMTDSLEAGGVFESAIDPADRETSELLSTLGIDLAKANLVLYFIPDSTQPEPGRSE